MMARRTSTTSNGESAEESSPKRKKRALISCDRCKARKTKCVDPVPGPCRFCASIGASCRTDPSRRRQRPYYHVSEEEFRYMTRVLRHYVPDREFNLQSLKSLAESLGCAEPADKSKTGSPSLRPGGSKGSITTHSEKQESEAASTSEESITIDEIGQLYGKLAWLTVDSRGNYRHVGVDSGFGFNATVRSFKQGRSQDITEKDIIGPLRAGNLPPETPESSMGMSPLSSVYLPPRELSFTYAARFFTEVHAVYWFFSTEQFYSQLDNIYADEGASASASWLCLLYSMFALSSEGLPSSCDSMAVQDRSPAEYFSMAKALVPAVCDEADTDSIRALCLLALALQSACFSNTAYLYVGTAVRIAFSLGLHLDRSLSCRSSLEREYDRRIWRTLYILDHDAALRYGNPCAIEEENAPTVLHEPSEQILSPGTYMPLGYLGLSCELSKLKRQISKVLYAKARSESQKIPVSRVSRFLQSLVDWFSGMPNHLRDLSHVASIHKRAVGILHLRYWSAVLFATRPFLLYSTLYGSQLTCNEKRKWFDDFSSNCIEAAERSLNILKRLAGSQALSSLTTIDCAWVLEDMQVFLLALAKTGLTAYKKCVKDCVEVLQTMECIGWTKHALNEALTQLEESSALDEQSSRVLGRETFSQSFMNTGQENEIFPNFINSNGTDLWDYFGVGECDVPIAEDSFDDSFSALNASVLT